jgi:hypothetical protein
VGRVNKSKNSISKNPIIVLCCCFQNPREKQVAILNCPGCGRGGLRVPDGRRGKVTCPACGAEWFYPESIEVSEVEFRCSASGARFVIVLTRRSPFHKFVIQAVKNAPPRAAAQAAVDGTDALTKHLSVTAHDPTLLPSRAKGWLARIAGLEGQLASSERTVAHQSVPAPSLTTYDAEQYNWSSFFCPYCNAKGFVKCSGGHLACDAGVQIRSGSRFHQCFCGNAGFISGTIETFEGRQSTLADIPAAANAAAEHSRAERREGLSPVALPQAGIGSSKRVLRKT